MRTWAPYSISPNALDRSDLQLHALEQIVGALDNGIRPLADHRDPSGGQGIFGRLGIRPQEAAGTQQDPAEITGHNAADVLHALPPEDL